MRLITFIEQEFQVKVQPEDVTIENFSTIKIISDYLARHGAQ
jgi:acyl carrier protein